MSLLRPPQDTSAHIAGPRLAILMLTLALTLIGLVMVYSASAPSAISEQASAASYLKDQLVFAGLGIAAGFVFWRFVPYELWRSPLFYAVWGVAVLMLVAVAVSGTVSLGAKRWLYIGSHSIQPSEFVKFVLVIGMARLLSRLRSGDIDMRKFAVRLVLGLLVPLLFLYRTQSDLGTTAIIAAGIIGVLWLGEVPWKVIAATVIVGALLVVASIVTTQYRSGRMLYLDPWNDGEGGRGAGYQIIHSYYAFSQGGLFGSGLGNSREKFLYLPESETDFIFAVIGEEFGLLGCLIVIGLFLGLLWAGLQVARHAPDDFASMVAGSLTMMLVAQAFLNIGCVIGVFPTTGKPLPFISSGGSSLISSFIMVGIILSVSRASGETVYSKRRDNLRIVKTGGSAEAGGGRGGAALWDSVARSVDRGRATWSGKRPSASAALGGEGARSGEGSVSPRRSRRSDRRGR